MDAPPTGSDIATRTTFFTFEAAYQRGAINLIPSNAAAFAIGAQGVGKSYVVWAATELAIGSTDTGLGTIALRVMFGGGMSIGVFRLGGGFDVGAIDVARRTNGDHLFGLTMGFFVRGELDVWRFIPGELNSLYLTARGGVETSESPIYSATFGLGVRL